MKSLFAVVFILLSANSNAYSSRIVHNDCTCATELQEKLDNDARDMNDFYHNKFDSYVKIDNDAEFLEGSNKENAIILIHGFIASPFEVRAVAKRLNEIGYTVYMPLLYGFGADGQTANAGKLSIWREQIKAAVKSLSGCYKKISLGGISLGAALATDYVLKTHDPKISSLVLMSPYYDISQSVAKLIVGPLSSVKDSFDLSTLFTVSHSDDLVEILKFKRYYSNIMPFNTLQELFKFSDELKAKESVTKSNVPVFLAYSEFDTTINLETADSLPRKHFNNVQLFKLPKELKVPHQITYASSNPRFDEMLRKIAHFIGVSNF
ncbi:MAG: alpha/beta fold hydrolase [Rhizobacter sp.]|nr:alpha/beta fold hydrolase [Bacteriovorax sp.]